MWNTGSFLTVPRLLCWALPGCLHLQAFLPITQQGLSWLLVHTLHLCPILFLSVAKLRVSLSHLPQELHPWEPSLASPESYFTFQDPWCPVLTRVTCHMALLTCHHHRLLVVSPPCHPPPHTMGSLRPEPSSQSPVSPKHNTVT